MKLIKGIEKEKAISEAISGSAVIAPKTKAKPEAVYEKLNKECTADIIINKKTARTDKTLVLIPGKQIYMVYDEKNDQKLVITDKSQLNAFFIGLDSNAVVLKKGELSIYDKDVTKEKLATLFDKVYLGIENRHGTLYAVKKNIVKFSDYISSSSFMVMDRLYNIDPKLIRFISKFYPEMYMSTNTVDFIENVYSVFGWDILKKCFSNGSLPFFSGCDKEKLFKYNLDGTSFSEYVKNVMPSFHMASMQMYYDYLDMSLTMYGKIEDKYPKSLLTEHDKLATLIRERDSLQQSCPEFSTVMEECEDFSYYNALDKFKIVMPKESSELVNEGTVLGHCVSSYAPKVVNGDCIIVFMRTMDSPDVPYLTVEVSPGRKVTEIEGANKRTELTKDEIVFLNRWAKNKQLEIVSPNAIMIGEEKEDA